MKEYIITIWSDEHKHYCLECLCGTDKKHAEKVLKERQAQKPDAKFRVEEVENDDCWWNQGYLD